MKIDNSFKIGHLRTEETKQRRPEPDTGGKVAPAKTAENIDLTRTSARLQQLESQLSKVDAIDTAKVEAVRQAIANGSFNANDDAIAEKLVNSIVEGLRRQAK